MSFPSTAQTGIGIVTPYDFALDRELWRWTPDDVSLHLTRLPHSDLEVTVEMARLVGDADRVARSATDLVTIQPSVAVYACTSGSFIRGLAGERAICDAMRATGTPDVVTTSGALLEALAHLGTGNVAIATPYEEAVTIGLRDFLAEAGLTVVGGGQLGLTSEIWKVPYDVTADLVRHADTPTAEAIFVSCTNLATYDLIGALEEELHKPVVTANQATMWAALRLVDRAAVGPGQWLLSA